MHTLTWNHTRTGKPMQMSFKTHGAALAQVLMIRQVRPRHPMFLNGEPV